MIDTKFMKRGKAIGNVWLFWILKSTLKVKVN